MLGNTTGQDSGGVQVRKGGGGGGGSQVVSGHIDGLDRCDGSLLGGGDTLLHGTHVSGKSWLVTDSRWDTTEQSRHLRTGQPTPTSSTLISHCFANIPKPESSCNSPAAAFLKININSRNEIAPSSSSSTSLIMAFNPRCV